MKIRNKYVAILLSVVFSFFICGNSFARETWENKALAEGVWNCYYALSNKLDYIITDRVVMDDVDSINNIIANNNENFVPLIYGKFKIDDAGLSCRQLFAGYKGATQSFEGLLGTLSKSTVLTTNERKTILEKMGYKANKDANTGGKCFVLKYRYFEKDINGNIKNDSNKETQQVCIPSSSSKVTDIVVSGEKGNIFFNKTNKKITLKIPKDVLDRTYSALDTNTEDTFMLADYNSLDELRQAIVNAASARFKAGYDGSTAIRWSKNDNGWYVDFDSRDPVRTFNYNESSGIEYTFGGYSDNNTLRLDGRKDASIAAISNLVGVGIKYYDDLKFSSLERVGLYKYYIKDYYKADYDCNWAESQNATKEAVEAQGYTIIEPENGSGSCIIKATDHKSDTVNGLNKDMHFSDTKYSLKDIAVVLNNESNIDIEEELEKPSSTDVDSGEYTGSGSTGPCWNSGIDSMAWVMCPVESNLKDFAKGMGQYIDKWLQVDSELYKNGSSTQIAWGYVRTIANTLMIIFMAVIIFSQLTGYGIDNYGIKKLLPKFIVMALLINLSFFVCQVVVDLSSIIGNGIQSLFYAIGNNIIADSSAGAQNVLETNFIDAVTKAVYALVTVGPGVVGAGMVIASAYSGGGAVLAVILVLLMLLTIVAAVLMFFVSLGARMVIIIMCMILAPLAFVCYILPNTKPVYKKWYDAFKAAIIIYPICGFTIGVSYIVKAIVLTQSEPPLFMVVVSGIVPYLPFFMIPTMLKSAIGAIGTVGAALGSLGSSFKSGAGKLQNNASGLIKDSTRFKNAQAETTRTRQANWANKVKNRLDKKSKNGGELNSHDIRMRALAQHTLDKQNAEDVAALQSSFANDERYSGVDGMTKLADDLQNSLSNYKDGDVAQKNRINALTNLMVSRGGMSAAGTLAGAISGAGLGAGSAAYNVLRDNMAANHDFSNVMKSKSGSMFDRIQSLGKDSMVQSLANGSLSSVKDWATQGKGEIDAATRAVNEIRARKNSGEELTGDEQKALDHFDSITKQIMESDDPNIRTNYLGDPEKRELWAAAAGKIPGYNVPVQASSSNSSGTFKVGSARADDQFDVDLRTQGKAPELERGTTEFRTHEYQPPQQSSQPQQQRGVPTITGHGPEHNNGSTDG